MFNKIHTRWKNYLVKSRKYGILYYISEMKRYHHAVNRMRKRIKNSKSRGICSWCTYPITPTHASYRVCKTCKEFKKKTFLHALCVHKDGCCEGCRIEEWMKSNRRVQ